MDEKARLYQSLERATDDMLRHVESLLKGHRIYNKQTLGSAVLLLRQIESELADLADEGRPVARPPFIEARKDATKAH